MPINVEIFSCAGGMAEGFRRAGVVFDLAIDFEPEHCDSYEQNLGHRPVCMDARDLLRMVQLGWLASVDLLVADPPCTPWSRAGKREGVTDERDMLLETCELIAHLQPRAYLIGNVPGLDDAVNWRVVQQAIGGLGRFGYCTADYIALDAADYGVPQHRIRPFWFGHREGRCIRWPLPTHCAPEDVHPTLAGIDGLRPWVTCREALGHLEGEELGRPVHLRQRAQNGQQQGSVAERPARVVGTSNLSDGNVIVSAARPEGRPRRRTRHDHPEHASAADAPARTLTREAAWAGNAATILVNDRHAPAKPAKPAPTMGAKMRGQSAQVLEWPWNRPATTIQRDDRVPPPGHHDASWATRSLPSAVQISERAATILQGFPETWVFSGKTKTTRWSQIGQAMPPPLAHAVATSVVAQMISTGVDPSAPRPEPETHVVFERPVIAAPREQLALPDPPPPEPKKRPRRRKENP